MAIILVLFVGCLVFALVCYNKRKGGRGGRGDNGAGGDGVGMALLDGSGAPSSKLTPLPVDLERIVARGRFGAVWKGRVRPGAGGSEAQHAAAGEGVAVKIFQQSQQDRNSWNVEREIFELPRMEHDNILKFMGVDIKDTGGRTEYWLMTKFLDRGKLDSFLEEKDCFH